MAVPKFLQQKFKEQTKKRPIDSDLDDKENDRSPNSKTFQRTASAGAQTLNLSNKKVREQLDNDLNSKGLSATKP
jgi:hypothetical protein